MAVPNANARERPRGFCEAMQIRSLFRGRSSNGVDINSLLKQSDGRIHLGCNDVRLDGFVNVDLRSTKATDVVHDCKDLAIFPSKSLSFVYSNAFLEHVYLADQQRLMRDVQRVLADDGWVAFTGLPDFEGVARAYLERRTPGNVLAQFNLHEAYRYTHGAPEGKQAWWQAQLHKVLLDAPTVLELCKSVGFGSCEVFSYCWGNEPNQVTLGFTATKRAVRRSILDPNVKAQLDKLPANINWGTAVIKDAY
jgi:predicted SAM-dependent methyltransferase